MRDQLCVLESVSKFWISGLRKRGEKKRISRGANALER